MNSRYNSGLWAYELSILVLKLDMLIQMSLKWAWAQLILLSKYESSWAMDEVLTELITAEKAHWQPYANVSIGCPQIVKDFLEKSLGE